MNKLKIFIVTINGVDFRVNAENEYLAKWSAVAKSVGRGDCTDAEYFTAKIQRVIEATGGEE
jgi:hypothetical protein